MDDDRLKSGRRRMWAGWVQRRQDAAGMGVVREFIAPEMAAAHRAPTTRCDDRATCPSCSEVLRHDLFAAVRAIPAQHRATYLLSVVVGHLDSEECQRFANLLEHVAAVHS